MTHEMSLFFTERWQKILNIEKMTLEMPAY